MWIKECIFLYPVSGLLNILYCLPGWCFANSLYSAFFRDKEYGTHSEAPNAIRNIVLFVRKDSVKSKMSIEYIRQKHYQQYNCTCGLSVLNRFHGIPSFPKFQLTFHRYLHWGYVPRRSCKALKKARYDGSCTMLREYSTEHYCILPWLCIFRLLA